ncbi:hypothetical protein LR48_Vigan03g080400 [Vigna angularis]|uniref:Uncharacterized protein n=1 Tax=Phaseolus angularis TaxID=3914 RepID=A0A0L9U412_PHAAN|nr:hypothetical protein LR48_Vigan03g080400 [Vigna angularis]
MMIREREIKDYVGLSGNVVVLQTCWEWFVREEDRGNRIIRAVLHLDEWAIPQHGVNDFGMSWEDLVMKRIEENQRTMVEMNKEVRDLTTMVGNGRQERQQPSFFAANVHGEPDDGDVHGEVDDANVQGEADDVDVHAEENEAAPSFQTAGYTNECGCLDKEKDDVEDVGLIRMFLFLRAQECFFLGTERQVDNMLFVHHNHWWCYNVKIPSMEMFALDSVGHNRKECKKIDTVIILDVDNVLRDEVLQDLGFS